MSINVEQTLNSDELQRAYDIHGMYYDGKEVPEEDSKFYDGYVSDLSTNLHKEFVVDGNKQNQTYPMGLVIWLLYATKYIREV